MVNTSNTGALDAIFPEHIQGYHLMEVWTVSVEVEERTVGFACYCIIKKTILFQNEDMTST